MAQRKVSFTEVKEVYFRSGYTTGDSRELQYAVRKVAGLPKYPKRGMPCALGNWVNWTQEGLEA